MTNHGRVRMRGNANCSEMVMILLTIVLYVSRLALLLEGYIQRRTVYYEIQVGLCAFKTLLAYVTSVIITTVNAYVTSVIITTMN